MESSYVGRIFPFVLMMLVFAAHIEAKYFSALQPITYFDGSTDIDHADASLATFGGTDHTVIAWFKTYASNGGIFAKTASGTTWASKGKCFYIRDGNIQTDSHGIGYIRGSKVVNDGKWHMAAWQFTASSNSYRLTVDGVQDTTGTLALATDDGNHVMRIGNCADNFVGKFTGHLHTVMYYDYRIGNTDLEYVYRNSLNSREYIWIEETYFGGDGQYYKNSTEAWTAVPNWSRKFNNFGKFDFSLSVWVRTTHTGSILRRTESSGTWVSHGKVLYINSAGKAMFDAYSVGNVVSTSVVNDDQWHFIVFTQEMQTTATWRIYVDGVLEASQQSMAMTEDLGDHVIFIANTFQGYLKELFYYNYKISDEEILSRYNGFQDDTQCPTGWHPFQGSCYYFEEANSIGYDGIQAKDFCHSLGAKRASISSQLEQDFLYHVLQKMNYTGRDWWLGLQQEDSSVNEYNFWDDGSRVLWSLWDSRDPDSSAKDCVRCLQDRAMEWNDRWCVYGDLWNVVCEKPEECRFVHIEGQKINLNAFDKSVTSTTVADCKRACLDEKTFTCRSFNFRVSDSACDLMTHNRYTITSNQWVEDANTDYYERQCTTDQENACEPGWFEWRGQCYKFSDTQSSFENASSQCQSDGGNLASINSAEEMSFIKEKARTFYKDKSFYIGMQWGGHGHSWIDGSSVFYSNFAHGEGRLMSITCENNMAELDCGQGQVVRVSYANFGRTSLTHCNGTVQRSDCLDSTSLNTVVDTCNGIQKCSVNASGDIFSESDTCGGATRYLEIHYNCVPASVYSSYIVSPTGCQCYFNHSRYDCACCAAGSCQCGPSMPHKCVTCGGSCSNTLHDHGESTCVVMSAAGDYNWYDDSCQRTDLFHVCKQAREVIAPLQCTNVIASGSNTATCPEDAPNAVACHCSCSNFIIKNYGRECDCSLCGTQTETLARCCANTPPAGYDPGPDYRTFMQCKDLPDGDPYTGVTCPADEYPTMTQCACGYCGPWWMSGNNTCSCDTSVTSDWVTGQCCRFLFSPRTGGNIADKYIRWQGAYTSGHDDWSKGSTTLTECLQHCENQVGCRSLNWNPSTGACILSKENHRTAPSSIQTQGSYDLYERYNAALEDHPSLVRNYFHHIEGYAVAGYNVLSSAMAVTVDTCLLLCLENPDCKSVDYDYVSSAGCWLNSETRISMPSSFNMYYNYDYYEFIDNGDPQLSCNEVTETGNYAYCGMIGTWMEHFNMIEYGALAGYNNVLNYGTAINDCLQLCHDNSNCKTIDQRNIDSGSSDYVCDLSYDTRFTVGSTSDFMTGTWPSYNNFVFKGFRGDYLKDSFQHIPGHYVMWSTLSTLTKTVAECMALCYNNAYCRGFDYRSSDSTCTLKNQNRFSQPAKFFVADANWDHYEFIGSRASITSCSCSHGCRSLHFQNEVQDNTGNRCYCHGNERATSRCCTAQHKRRPPCPPGTYSPTGYYGKVRCTPCPLGTYSSDRGSTECKVCPTGHISNQTGQMTCVLCPYNGVTDELKQKCMPCKAGYVTDGRASQFCRQSNCQAPGVAACQGQSCTEGRSSAGSSFVVMFPETLSPNATLKLFFSADPSESVSVTVTSPGWSSPAISETVTVSSTGTTNVVIPRELMMTGTSKSSTGLLISSSAQISVHGVLSSSGDGQGDWFQVLPTASLGLEHYATCWTPGPGDKTLIGIVATADNTLLVITLTAAVTLDGQDYMDGQKIIVTLNQHETLQLQSDGDLTGSHISADKLVAVFSGNMALNVTAGQNQNQTGTSVEPMLPVATWGTVFAKPSVPTGRVDFVLIMSSLEHTVLTMKDGRTMKLVKRGQKIIMEHVSGESEFYITASKPVQAVAFISGGDVAPPAMLLLPPFDQGGNHFSIGLPSTSRITVLVDPCQASGMRINGHSLPPDTLATPFPSAQNATMVALTFYAHAGLFTLSHAGGHGFVAQAHHDEIVGAFSIGVLLNVRNSVTRRTFQKPHRFGTGYAISDNSKILETKSVRHLIVCLNLCMEDPTCHSVVHAFAGANKGQCELVAHNVADLADAVFTQTDVHEIYQDVVIVTV